MWTRKQLKENAKKILSKNYWKAFLVTLVLITITGAGSGAFSGASNGISSFSNYKFNRSSSNDAKISLNSDRKDNDQDKDQDKENSKRGEVNVDLGEDGKFSVKVETARSTSTAKRSRLKTATLRL